MLSINMMSSESGLGLSWDLTILSRILYFYHRPIHIEFGEGLKMEDGTKWALMLQSQLHNKNNSIINGIILWKENIDKKLSGIE